MDLSMNGTGLKDVEGTSIRLDKGTNVPVSDGMTVLLPMMLKGGHKQESFGLQIEASSPPEVPAPQAVPVSEHEAAVTEELPPEDNLIEEVAVATGDHAVVAEDNGEAPSQHHVVELSPARVSDPPQIAMARPADERLNGGGGLAKDDAESRRIR